MRGARETRKPFRGLRFRSLHADTISPARLLWGAVEDSTEKAGENTTAWGDRETDNKWKQHISLLGCRRATGAVPPMPCWGLGMIAEEKCFYMTEGD